MILPDYDISYLARAGMIEPFAGRLTQVGVVSWGMSSYGYDATLGTKFKRMRATCETILDPLEPSGFYDFESDQPFAMLPGEFLLAHTVEYFRLPRDVTAFVMDKSTYARSGIHCQNTVLEAGWHGQVTLELYNYLNRPVLLRPGQGIVQVVFLRGEPCEVSYADRQGKYQGQTGVTLPKVMSLAYNDVEDAARRAGL